MLALWRPFRNIQKILIRYEGTLLKSVSNCFYIVCEKFSSMSQLECLLPNKFTYVRNFPFDSHVTVFFSCMIQVDYCSLTDFCNKNSKLKYL